MLFLRSSQVLLVPLLMVAASSRSQGQRAPESPLLIRNVTLVDVRNGSLQPEMSVLVRGDSIVQVTRGQLAVRGARLLNGTGKYMIPGLVDTHVHLFQPWRFNWPDSLAQLGWILASGVTTVRDAAPGGLDASYAAIQKAIAAGTLTGPRIVRSGDIYWVLRMKEARDSAEALRAFRRLGLNQVKLVGSVPRDAALDLIRAARASGYQIFGHTLEFLGGNQVNEYALDAIDAGISGLSHSSGKGMGGRVPDLRIRGWLSPDTAWLRQLIAKAVTRGVWLEPTLTVNYASESVVYGQCTPGYDEKRLLEYFTYYSGPRRLTSAGAADTARRICANHWKFIKDFHDAGGMIIAGSDYVPFAPLGVVEEIRLLVAAGLTPLAALQAATVNAAKALELSDQIGTVEAGKRADLLILDANPLEDIGAVRRVSVIVARGAIVDAAKLWARKGTNPPMLTFNRRLAVLDSAVLRFAQQRPDSTIDVLLHTDGTETAEDLRRADIEQVISASPKRFRVRASALDVSWMSRARFIVRIELAPPQPDRR